jgi:hypothetical protein
MVTDMRNAWRFLWLWLVLFGTSGLQSASAHCDTSPDLSAAVSEFESNQTSRVAALLRFGQIHNLCFGIEYVDAKLLTEVTDFHIRNMPIRECIKVILGQERKLTVSLSNGIIEVSQETLQSERKSIFDHVLPRFEVRRSSVQEISTALYMQLIADLNPQITGFAGSYPAGDLKDEVGPISEHSRSIRYLLDELVARSKGGTWIARVQWKSRGDLTIPERRRVWTIVEYGVSQTGYDSLLNSIAGDLESDPPSRRGGDVRRYPPNLSSRGRVDAHNLLCESPLNRGSGVNFD